MVFGVFDRLHEGHRHFLIEARSKCDILTVVVTPDDVSLKRKGFSPKHSLEERMNALKAFDMDMNIIKGDSEDSSWHVIDEHDPSRVFLGYDQSLIAEELKKMGIPYTFLDAYKPEEFKSSLMGERSSP